MECNVWLGWPRSPCDFFFFFHLKGSVQLLFAFHSASVDPETLHPPPPRTPRHPPTPPVSVTDQPFINSLSCDRWLLSLPSCLGVARRLLLLSSHSRYKDKERGWCANLLWCMVTALGCCCVKRAGGTRQNAVYVVVLHFAHVFSSQIPNSTAPHRTCTCILWRRSF